MAHILDRKYIGIEISEEYCEIIHQRIKEQRNQTRLKQWFDEGGEELA
jgi:DNA modification methylase